jgi:hypothetical protein
MLPTLGIATVLLLASCTSGSQQSTTPSHNATPPQSKSTGSPESVGSDAATVLQTAFKGREELGGGHGQLQASIGNTLAKTPTGVLSVTFAFVCTGGGEATIQMRVDGRAVQSARGIASCDNSIFQQSAELAKPGLVGYEASVEGPTSGSFAYAYYTEKKQIG